MGAVRIIGGRWRGRRLPVPPVEGLRPTPDRLRETLFNWLAPHLPGARCLDLFAGSGVLGLEAASRGAGEVVLVENHIACVKALQRSIELLDAVQVRLVKADALPWLAGAQDPFDVVFLDPPYASDLLSRALVRLAERALLAPGALLFMEQTARATPPPMPEGWTVHRESRAGQALGRLLRVASPAQQPQE